MHILTTDFYVLKFCSYLNISLYDIVIIYLFLKSLQEKEYYHSIIYIISIRVATKLIRKFSVFTTNNSVKYSPLDRSVNVVNTAFQFLDFLTEVRFLWKILFRCVILVKFSLILVTLASPCVFILFYFSVCFH
jgi:hypothetical protein